MKAVSALGVLAMGLIFTLSLSSTAGAIGVLLNNSSFEEPLIPGTGYTDVDPSGWVVNESVATQVELFRRADVPPADGQQALTFNAFSSPNGASIHQAFSTIPGVAYEVSYWTTANIPVRSSVESTVFDGLGLSGLSLGSITSALGGEQFSYTETVLSFVAISGTSTIAFIDNSPNTIESDLFLDHVVITIIPEPGTFILFSLGPLALVIMRPRR